MGKRGPTCSICDDPRIEEINTQIIHKQKLAKISREFAVSEDALYRHNKKCVIRSLAASPSTKDIINGDDMLDPLREAREKALSLLDMAVDAGDTKTYGAPSNYPREIRERLIETLRHLRQR